MAESLFNAMGTTIQLPAEDMLNAATALSGSGPAYFFYLMAAMMNAGRRMGVSEDMAYLLMKQTMLGAYHMMENAQVSPHELIGIIASKGGTTQAALDVLASGDVATYIEDAILAAKLRAKELAGDG
jgi:pyrroline-5-carboxylate reductase